MKHLFYIKKLPFGRDCGWLKIDSVIFTPIDKIWNWKINFRSGKISNIGVVMNTPFISHLIGDTEDVVIIHVLIQPFDS